MIVISYSSTRIVHGSVVVYYDLLVIAGRANFEEGTAAAGGCAWTTAAGKSSDGEKKTGCDCSDDPTVSYRTRTVYLLPHTPPVTGSDHEKSEVIERVIPLGWAGLGGREIWDRTFAGTLA